MLKKLVSLCFCVFITIPSAQAGVIKYGTTEINALDLNSVSSTFTEFYGFNGTSATTGLEVVDSVIMFFAELNGEYALFTIGNKYRAGGSNGSLDVSITADSGSIEFVDDLKEDSGTNVLAFNWGGNLTDGFIFSGLTDTFNITIDLFSKKGVTGAYVIDFTNKDLNSASYTSLIALDDGPFVFSSTNSASLSSVPEPKFLLIVSLLCLLFSQRKAKS